MYTLMTKYQTSNNPSIYKGSFQFSKHFVVSTLALYIKWTIKQNFHTHMTYTNTAVDTKSCGQVFIKLCEAWSILFVTQLCHTQYTP